MRFLKLVAGVFLIAAVLVAGFIALRNPERTPSPSTSSAADPTAEAREQLNGIRIAKPNSMSGYSRTKFPHWQLQKGKCDTRKLVLQREGQDVRTTTNCKVISGTWVSAYDGITLTTAENVDIDHLVPLANAWRSGANEWDNKKRGDFANDLQRPQLIGVTQASNRAKGDQDPSQWKPADRGYWCTYAKSWITVKSYWDLTVTEKERSALMDMLETCR